MRTIKKFSYWVPTIIWMMLIFYVSGRTSTELQLAFPFIEDLNPGHIAAYFVLALLAFYSFHKSRVKRPFVATLVLAITYGITDEFHQSFVPTRQPDIADLVRDTIGTLAALLVIRMKQSTREKKTKTKDKP